MEESRTKTPLYVSEAEFKTNLAVMSKVLNVTKDKLSFDSYHDKEIILDALKTWLYVFLAYGFQFKNHLGPHHSVRYEKLAMQVFNAYAKARIGAVATSWVTYFKYKNAAFFSSHNGQILPPAPEGMLGNPKYLFGGPFKKFIGVLKRNNLLLSFSTSILQSKKGMPRPNTKMVREAETKSFLTMTTIKPESTWEYRWVLRTDDDELRKTTHRTWAQQQHKKYKNTVVDMCIPEDAVEFEHSITYGRSHMEYQIDRTTRDLFRNWRPDLEALTEIFLPSSSSNYNNTRGKLGTYGFLEGIDFFQEFRNTAPTIDFELYQTALCGYVSEWYGQAGQADTEEWKDLIAECLGLNIKAKEFLACWRKFYWKCVDFALREKAFVEVVGLSEALKVRCISKGPPMTYFVLKPFQKSIWKHLQGYWNFELTGRPVTEEWINEHFPCREGVRMHSGDYSAATDELHSYASRTCANAMFDCAEKNVGYSMVPFRTLFLRALIGHIYQPFDYTLDGRRDRLDEPELDTDVFSKTFCEHVHEEFGSCDQKRGQLMGSVVSFVVLCVVNLALLRTSYELAHNVQLPIKDLPVAINGDDCVTAYTAPRFPEIWRGLGSVVGLTESVGKTYDDETFFTINSVLYKKEQSRWVEEPFINFGLLNGTGRSVSVTVKEDTKDSLLELGTRHRELIRTCPKGNVRNVHTLFLYLNCDTLREFKGSWFLPNWLGGLGLSPVQGYSEKELRFAGEARLAIGQGLAEAPRIQMEKEWLFYDAFNKVLTQRGMGFACKRSFTSYYGEDTYGRAFSTVVWAMWLSNHVNWFTRESEFSHVPAGKRRAKAMEKASLTHRRRQLGKLVKFRQCIKELRKDGLLWRSSSLSPWEIEPEPKNFCTPLACF